MIFLDTSVVIDGLTAPRRSAPALREAIDRGERLILPTLVLYEWLRGPRRPEELEAQQALFPADSSTPFGPEEAALAASIYKKIRKARGREIDIAIAACALIRNARLWTLNLEDFEDIPNLKVSGPGLW